MFWLRYVPVELIARMHGEGFSEVMVGEGPWVGDLRMLHVLCFIHPDGRVVTVEVMKQRRPDDGMTMYAGIQEHRYSASQLVSQLAKYRVTFVGAHRFADFVAVAAV